MPKQKTYSGCKKRFGLASNGQVKFARPGKGHFSTKKSQSNKRKVRKGSYISGKHTQNIKSLLAK